MPFALSVTTTFGFCFHSVRSGCNLHLLALSARILLKVFEPFFGTRTKGENHLPNTLPLPLPTFAPLRPHSFLSRTCHCFTTAGHERYPEKRTIGRLSRLGTFRVG